jgi:hypothetical protein
VQELAHVKSFAMLIEEGDYPVYAESAKIFAFEAVTEQLIMSVNLGSCDDRRPLTADGTISVNMFDTDSHA